MARFSEMRLCYGQSVTAVKIISGHAEGNSALFTENMIIIEIYVNFFKGYFTRCTRVAVPFLKRLAQALS